MGQALRRAGACLRRNPEEAELERRRQYELTLPGIPALLREAYGVEELLHDGVHGQVHALVHLETERPLALKAYAKARRSFQFLGVAEHALAIAELKAGQLQHPHLCAHLDFFESQDLFCVVAERCDGGSVRGLLEEKLRLDDATAAKVLSQALSALGYLHGLRILHRDVRPEQLLFASPKRTKVKLCDLLHCARPREGRRLTDPRKPAALLFAAPESLKRGEYSPASDVYSAGCCLFELIYGHPPFTGEGGPLARRIAEEAPDLQPLFSSTSKKSMDLLGGLLEKDPAKRKTVSAAMMHGWFRSAKDITQAQERAELVRLQKLEATVAELKILRRRRVMSDHEGDEAAALQSQYSRSLTDSCSHLSDSTPSEVEEGEEEGEEEKEREDDARSPERASGQRGSDKASVESRLRGSDRSSAETRTRSSDPGSAESPTQGLGRDSAKDRLLIANWGLREDPLLRRGEAEETDSEDWQVGSGRSDLESGPPPSGDGSLSDTYANSETEFFARTKGFWDEFDSEFHDEDVQNSSCWSEAEFSDWTSRSAAKRDHDREFRNWAGLRTPPAEGALEESAAPPGGPLAGGPRLFRSHGALDVASAAGGAEEARPAAVPGSQEAGPPGAGAPGGAARAAAAGAQPAPAAAPPPAAAEAAARGGAQDAAASQRSGGLSRHSSEELELAARERAEAPLPRAASGGLGGGSSSTSSAPWEFSERSSASAASGGSGAGRPRAGAEQAAARRRAAEEAAAAQLATIDERAELAEAIGEVTSRSLAARAAPWEAGAPRSGGIVVLSRRSGSSSSSSARDGASSRNEFGLAQERSGRAA